MFWKLKLQNQRYCFALQCHDTFFSRIVLNDIQSHVLTVGHKLKHNFTHHQVRKTKPLWLQEISSETTTSKKHLHVHVKSKCNQITESEVHFLKAVYFIGLMDYQKAAPLLILFSLFPCSSQNRLEKFNSELSEVDNEISQSSVMKMFMNKRKLCHLHFLVQLF